VRGWGRPISTLSRTRDHDPGTTTEDSERIKVLERKVHEMSGPARSPCPFFTAETVQFSSAADTANCVQGRVTAYRSHDEWPQLTMASKGIFAET
jgi:hypothetical protein